MILCIWYCNDAKIQGAMGRLGFFICLCGGVCLRRQGFRGFHDCLRLLGGVFFRIACQIQIVAFPVGLGLLQITLTGAQTFPHNAHGAVIGFLSGGELAAG